ncbi:MAG: hypothetical protein ONB48_21415 [candidate division KSB1 bacterium]|nr:hypothetical protein [candidate division KSB1 bacterium]MDZ7274840.1 hypothetical protein [candidate division KSB1 bacterium]MDZ7288207.1 hypothetical protein [candidate division KSB1 bacterium]MDZ7300412.1 hypothetical protein [candidate division KSB1 bacterium]MDZ7308133.1 hypothetical protein [candidate division KSB1 bacterium]
MRANVRVVARRLPGGFFALLALALVACSTSPTEQLARAEKLLSGLESKGADQYLTYELAEARRGIEEAKKFIRHDDRERANISLARVCQKLDSCSIAFLQLRRLAEAASRQRVQLLSSQLEVLEKTIAGLPRQTYVDQNRHDIHVHRLRRYHKDVESMLALIQLQNFPEVLRRAAELELQVQKALIGLTTSARFTTRPAPHPVAKERKKEEKQKTSGYLATTTR